DTGLEEPRSEIDIRVGPLCGRNINGKVNSPIGVCIRRERCPNGGITLPKVEFIHRSPVLRDRNGDILIHLHLDEFWLVCRQEKQTEEDEKKFRGHWRDSYYR